MLDFLKREETKDINVNELDNMIGKIELIDIREPYEVSGGSIKTAKNIPMGNLINSPQKYLIKNKTYYIMCQSGARSSRTVKMLAKQGYDVINVLGGMGSYRGSKRK